MALNVSSLNQKLSKPVSFLGVKLWVALIICIVLALILVMILALCILYRRQLQRSKAVKPLDSNNNSNVSSKKSKTQNSMNRRLLSSRNGWEIELNIGTPEKQVMYGGHPMSCNYSETPLVSSSIKPGNLYTQAAIEAATNNFAFENVIGAGDQGIVYHGILSDNTHVAVKDISSNSSYRCSSKSFMKKVEALCGVRHKNVVKLLGFCAEGASRLIMYEFVDNGNLKQWLHEYPCQISPLTWNIRMNIITGIAKGLAYLHEDTEAAIAHQRLKSSNILLDKQWCPRISDYGLADLTRGHAVDSVEMSGYLPPECYYKETADQKSDVYSFGVLIMEMVTGKTSVEYSVTEIEEYLVDWMKAMVGKQEYEEVVDGKLAAPPSRKELKRVLLIALRCVDPDAKNRPGMGEIIHMLEPRDLLLS